MNRSQRDPTSTYATFGDHKYPKAGLMFNALGRPILKGPTGLTIMPGVDAALFPRIPVLVKKPWTGADVNTVICSIANPFGAAAFVTRAWFTVDNADTGNNGVLDVGVAADATTLSDTLIDGAANNTGTAGVTINSQKHAGTNGIGTQAVGPTACVNLGANASSSAGASGALYAEFVLA